MDNKHYNIASVLYSQYLSNKSDLELINKAYKEIGKAISLYPNCAKYIQLSKLIQYELEKCKKVSK